MRLLGSLAVIGAGLVLAGFGAAPTPPDPQTGTVEYVNFLQAALAHAQSQLALAEMAEQKSKYPPLAAYARRVATQRAALIDQLDAAAKATGTEAVADTIHTPIARTFNPLTGETFERAYVAAELEDQQNALEEYQFAAAHITAPDLNQLMNDEITELQQDIADGISIVRDLPFDPESKTNPSSWVISPRLRN
jgi:predicted outer membrane protein